MAGDNDTNMKALLHFESSFTDSAAGIGSATTWTAQTGTAVSSSQKKFGTQALQTLQSASNALRGLFTPYRSEYSLAGSNPTFMASYWVYVPSQTFSGSAAEYFFAARSPSSFVVAWAFTFVPGTRQLTARIDLLNNGFGGVSINLGAISLDTWHYVELGKIGTTMYAALDGAVSTASLPQTNFATSIATDTTLGIAIGGLSDFSYTHSTTMFIDEAAYKIGTGPNTSTYTPPTAPWGTVSAFNGGGSYSYVGKALAGIRRGIFHARGTYLFSGKLATLLYGKIILIAAAGAYNAILQATLGSKNGRPILILAAEAGQYIKSGFTNYLLRVIKSLGLGDPPSLQKTRRNPPTLDM